jgi:hypothetical protein
MPSRVSRLAVLAFVASLALAGCGGGTEAGIPDPVGIDDAAPPGPSQPVVAVSTMPVGSPSAGVRIAASVGPSVELCERIEIVQSRLTALSALELRPTARVTLDIELSRVQAGFSDMRQDALDARDLDLDDSLRRLDYRLDDLALAVEDFRTTSRPREAASHVEEEAVVFADALAGFHVEAGC